MQFLQASVKVTPLLILKTLLTESIVHVLIVGKKTPGTREVLDSVSDAQRQKGHLNSSVIEISSDDGNDDSDNGDDYTDNHEDLTPGSSFSYPGIY